MAVRAKDNKDGKEGKEKESKEGKEADGPGPTGLGDSPRNSVWAHKNGARHYIAVHHRPEVS